MEAITSDDVRARDMDDSDIITVIKLEPDQVTDSVEMEDSLLLDEINQSDSEVTDVEDSDTIIVIKIDDELEDDDENVSDIVNFTGESDDIETIEILEDDVQTEQEDFNWDLVQFTEETHSESANCLDTETENDMAVENINSTNITIESVHTLNTWDSVKIKTEIEEEHCETVTADTYGDHYDAPVQIKTENMDDSEYPTYTEESNAVYSTPSFLHVKLESDEIGIEQDNAVSPLLIKTENSLANDLCLEGSNAVFQITSFEHIKMEQDNAFVDPLIRPEYHFENDLSFESIDHQGYEANSGETLSYSTENHEILPQTTSQSDASQSNTETTHQFQCFVCKKMFITINGLKSHIRNIIDNNGDNYCRTIKEGKRPYSCTVCKRKFSRPSNLKAHVCIDVLWGKGPFSCDICHRSFSRRRNLYIHLNRIHVLKPICAYEFCNKSFPNISDLKDHMKCHTDSEVHTCPMCWRCYHRLDLMQEHIESHQGQNRYWCIHCGRKYSNVIYFNSHMKIHTEKEQFKCTICDFRCAQTYVMCKHMKTHDSPSIKRWTCTYCDMKFIDVNDRDNHLRQTHSKEQQSKIFDRISTISSVLKNYMRTSTVSVSVGNIMGTSLAPPAAEALDYTCRFCGEKFSEYKFLKNHLNTDCRHNVMELLKKKTQKIK